MKFSDIIDQACTLLQGKGRLTYRSLKLEFGLDEEQLDVLKEELIEGQRVAVDEEGKVLVWVGTAPVLSPEPRVLSAPQPLVSSPQSPVSERRQITVLFCDLVGSTTLSTH